MEPIDKPVLEEQELPEPNFIVVYHDLETKKELARFTDIRVLPEPGSLGDLPQGGFFRISPYWQNYKNERTPICDLEMSHLVNIVKYFLAANLLPPVEIMNELSFRGLLSVISQWIPPQDGYMSPEKLKELVDERYDTISQNTDADQPSNDASDSGGVPEADSGNVIE